MRPQLCHGDARGLGDLGHGDLGEAFLREQGHGCPEERGRLDFLLGPWHVTANGRPRFKHGHGQRRAAPFSNLL